MCDSFSYMNKVFVVKLRELWCSYFGWKKKL